MSAGRTGERHPGLSSLRVRLMALTLAAIVPFVLLVAGFAAGERERDLAQARGQVLSLLRGAREGEARVAEGTRQTFLALSAVPELRGNERERAQRVLEGLRRSTGYFATLGVSRSDGTLFASSPPPPPSLTSALDRTYFQRAVRTGRFAMGDFTIGRISHTPVVTFALPTFDAESRLDRVIFGSIPLEWLGRYARSAVPPGAELILTDAQGTVLVREPDGGRWVGRPTSGTFIGTLHRQRAGDWTVVRQGLDGVERLYAFGPLGGDLAAAGQAWLFVGVSTEEAFGNAARRLRRTLLLLLVVTAAALALAWWTAERAIRRPVAQLADAVRRLAANDWSARAALPAARGELGALARAFDAMADGLARGHQLLERLVERRTESLEESNRRLTEAVEAESRRARVEAALGGLVERLLRCVTPEDARPALVEGLPPLFPDASGALYLVDEDGTGGAVVRWGDPSETPGTLQPAECGAISQRRIHVAPPRARGCVHAPSRPGTRTVCVPLVSGERCPGLLLVAWPGGRWDQALARQVAGAVALALENLWLVASLRERAIRDPLTGLFNRRFLEEALAIEVSRATRASSPIAVLMVDIDRFKELNDRVGHGAGDAVLREIGALLSQSVRGMDVACRYGGEEFVILLPGADLAGAVARSVALLEATRALAVDHEGERLGNVTVSIGVAAFPEHGRTGAELIAAADAALYRAKRGGRDRLAVAE